MSKDTLAGCSVFVLASSAPSAASRTSAGASNVQHHLQQDLRLRAAASLIYEAAYPRPEWAAVSFEEAERYETVHYRQALAAALRARPVLMDFAEQSSCI